MDGDWDAARKLGYKAMELSPFHPNWYRVVPYMVCFRNGDYKGALAIVEARAEEVSPLYDLGCLAAYAKLGQVDEARRLLECLDEKFSGYAENLLTAFKSRNIPRDFAAEITEIIEELRL